ncbi:hypothetical protein GCM10027168_11450 [Streptomyces capparidis]
MRMAGETDNGRWGNPYAVQFSFAIDNLRLFYGQNLKSNYWFIRNLFPARDGGGDRQRTLEQPLRRTGRVGRNATGRRGADYSMLPQGGVRARASPGSLQGVHDGTRGPFANPRDVAGG